MGNYPSETKATFNSYISESDGAQKEDQTELSLLLNVESELVQINTTVGKLKGKSPDEIEKELTTLLTDTERKLTHFHKKKKHLVHNPFKKKETDISKTDLKLKEENETLKREIQDLKRRHEEEIEKYKEKHNEDIERLEEEEMKNMQLLTRLSKEASEKLTKDNPAITDLSDTNRPTKLGELYSELYDNEWTDALDGLTKAGHNEEEAIATLYLTLLNVYEFCKKKAETMLTKTDDALNYLFEEYKLLQEKNEGHVTRMSIKKVPSGMRKSLGDQSSEEFELKQRWEYKRDVSKTQHEKSRASTVIQRSDKTVDKLKVFQREVAEILVPVVQKAYFKASLMDDDCVSELRPFIKKCIFICWMMVVQSPPMSIHTVDLEKEDQLNKNMYKEYTASGPVVEYIVWPAMLLHENGSVVCKGIAQCCKPDLGPDKQENVSSC